ncbi:MAG: SMC-Scp complex subunit ScpB [Gemmataceae bacterium]
MPHDAGEYAAKLQSASAMPESPPPLVRIIEAMLFAGGQPITAQIASAAIRGLTADQFQTTVDELARQYRKQNRPYIVRSDPKGYTLALKPAFQHVKQKLGAKPRTAKLTQPQLDVLSIVAYKQPVARKEIDALCNQDCSSLLRQLVRLGLISVSEKSAYSTTPRFLELFHLKSLDDLPRTLDLHKV